jgi:hypothetical protein
MNCTSCRRHERIAFNWKHRPVSVFERIGNLKFGEHYRCKVCGMSWFLDEESRGANMCSIPDEYQPLLPEWNRRPLRPTPEVFEALRRIGGTPPEGHGRESRSVSVPCRITTKRGERLDFTRVVFQKTPPLRLETKLFFIDKIASVEPSEYAMSRELRLVTSKAEELRMCFSPTLVEAPNGRLYVINGWPDFFDLDGVRGADLRLSARALDLKRPPPVYRCGPTNAVIADWEPSCLSLLIGFR